MSPSRNSTMPGGRVRDIFPLEVSLTAVVLMNLKKIIAKHHFPTVTGYKRHKGF
jgi:hypothetical protein